LPPDLPWVQISHTQSNLVELQIAVRKFEPASGRGPAVWLTGVSHIGDSNYYARLQKHLDAQTLVLFEGVSESSAPTMTPRTKNAAPAEATNAAPTDVATTAKRSSLQTALASSLGLVFQLEAIDYQRPNFRHSDLTIPELQAILAEQPGATNTAGADQTFDRLMQLIQGGTMFDTLLRTGLRFLGSSPKLQGMSKLALIEVLGQMQGDPGQLRGLPPSMTRLFQVLIQRRNQKVMSDLQIARKSAGPRGSIAIFYGCGHNPDLERRLREEMNYHPVEQFWLTAFSVDLEAAGITSSDLSLITNLVHQQMAPLQPPAKL
jgi:hypothetical protein